MGRDGARVEAQGLKVTPETLRIADNATLILPLHAALDGAREAARGAKKLGTTGRGIGPAYEDKVARRAVRVCDLAVRSARDVVRRMIRRLGGPVVRLSVLRSAQTSAVPRGVRAVPVSMVIAAAIGEAAGAALATLAPVDARTFIAGSAVAEPPDFFPTGGAERAAMENTAIWLLVRFAR